MKVLLVHGVVPLENGQVTFGAVEYHRMHQPHVSLAKLGHKYATVDGIENCTDEFLQSFDFLLFCRKIEKADLTARRLHKLGVKFGLDLDDYWVLPEEHVLFNYYQEYSVPAIIERSIKLSGFVIVTTEILAEKVRKLNKNVYIVENGIDPEVWKPEKIKSNRIRYGFTQGNTHMPDIMEIADDCKKSMKDDEFFKTSQIALFGFKKAEPGKGSIYIGYEKELTGNLEPLKFYPEYYSALIRQKFPNGIGKPYRRIEGVDISEFHKVYNEIDISVAPLKVSDFNSCKSNLKMLEAGFMDCAIMVSEVHPYIGLCTEANSFLLSKKSFYDWSKYILNNPQIIEDKKAQLKEDVKPYSLEVLSKKREQVYQDICELVLA